MLSKAQKSNVKWSTVNFTKEKWNKVVRLKPFGWMAECDKVIG